MAINIVIPMAGRGQRFVDAGYKVPKPFIEVEPNFPMIELVMSNLYPQETCSYTFLCLSNFLSTYGKDFEKIFYNQQYISKVNIIEVKSVTDGAACTVLLAEKLINNEEELIVANCDQLVLDPLYMKHSLNYYRAKKADGGIICFLNDSAKWSYCRVENEKVVEVVEKKVVSNLATAGIYWFRQGKIFVDAAKSMINQNIRVNGELYLAPCYNEMIKNNKKVVPYMVNSFVGLGTPEDLVAYQKDAS